MGTATYLSMVRFSVMVVTPREINVHTAVRPRIVMLWVFFLVTVVVVGPTIPASAFVSCTWHHSQLPGEHPGTVTDDTKPSTVINAKAAQPQRDRTLWSPLDASKDTSIATAPTPVIAIPRTGIAPRAPPATR